MREQAGHQSARLTRRGGSPLSENRLTLPNVITLARIAVCPVLFLMALSPTMTVRFGAFVLFVLAGLSDIWDGYLARRYDQITNIGKLLDPIADKLLLFVTFVPFFIISHRGLPGDLIPWWGPMPAWVLVIIFGREIFITIFRSYAVGRGVVIAAGKSGKQKALLQALFIGGLLLWYPLRMLAESRGVGRRGHVRLLEDIAHRVGRCHACLRSHPDDLFDARLPVVVPVSGRHSELRRSA